MTVAEALATTVSHWPSRALTDPHLDAEVLLAHVLGTDRGWLLAHPDATVDPTNAAAYQELVARRGRGEPVAYLTGHQAFFGHDFVVTSDVLIPRPESELLVERALARLAHSPNATVVDIGTGSGCIAISLALAEPTWSVIATDISTNALAVASTNAQRLGVRRRIGFRHGSLLAPIMADEQIDLIVANLPYLTDAQARDHALQFEPRQALIAGDDGLRWYEPLITAAAQRAHLPLFIEIDPQQHSAVQALASHHGYTANVARDLAGLARVAELVAA